MLLFHGERNIARHDHRHRNSGATPRNRLPQPQPAISTPTTICTVMSAREGHIEDGTSDAHSRPHSIDLSLALERELEAESLPTSPSNPRPQSLDTTVLASIVTQLRMNVEDVARERDALAKELADSKTREAEMSADMISVTERCTRLETELSAAHEKIKEDEESISMLRSKVEESRRGLMRLQTESRRMSQMSQLSLDLSRAGQPMLGSSTASKRASFTPLNASAAMRGHRRISSVSDSGMGSPPLTDSPWTQLPRSPIEPTYTSPPQSKAARRASGFFGFSTPAIPDGPVVVQVEAAALETMRKDLERVKDQLEEARHELSETQEAKEASEMCVRALRTFIADNSVGEQASRASTSVRPAPTPANTPQSGGTSRWGFKLWNATTPSPAVSPASTMVSPQPVHESPLSKKIAAVNPRASVSSTSSLLPPMQHMPSLAGSETSSVADSSVEPNSPVNELPPLNQTTIVLEDGSGLAFAPSESMESTKTVESTTTLHAQVAV